MIDSWIKASEPYIVKATKAIANLIIDILKETISIGMNVLQDIVGEWLYNFWKQYPAALDLSDPNWKARVLPQDYGLEPIQELTFQHGGIVPGIGSGDIVPALLEPGELVIPREMAGNGSSGRDGSYGGKTFNVVINVEGAGDPAAVAREIKKVLRDEERLGRGWEKWSPEFG